MGFESVGTSIVFGIITTFVLGLIISWVAGLSVKSEPKKEQTQIAHH